MIIVMLGGISSAVSELDAIRPMENRSEYPALRSCGYIKRPIAETVAAAEPETERGEALGDLPAGHDLCSQDEEWDRHQRRMVHAADHLLQQYNVRHVWEIRELEQVRRHTEHQDHLEPDEE